MSSYESRIEALHELMHAGEISQTELQQRLGIEGALMTRFAKQMEECSVFPTLKWSSSKRNEAAPHPATDGVGAARSAQFGRDR